MPGRSEKLETPHEHRADGKLWMHESAEFSHHDDVERCVQSTRDLISDDHPTAG